LGSGSTLGLKRPEACLIELTKTFVCRDIEINLAEVVLSSKIIWSLTLTKD